MTLEKIQVEGAGNARKIKINGDEAYSTMFHSFYTL
jgi:hypothetical protein